MCSTAGHLFLEQALSGSIPEFTSLEMMIINAKTATVIERKIV